MAQMLRIERQTCGLINEKNAIESSAIVPGDPSGSGMIDRVTSKDPGHVMPPPEFGKQLSPAQVEILNKWDCDWSQL